MTAPMVAEGTVAGESRRRWLALAVIVTAQFMVVLDVAIVNAESCANALRQRWRRYTGRTPSNRQPCHAETTGLVRFLSPPLSGSERAGSPTDYLAWTPYVTARYRSRLDAPNPTIFVEASMPFSIAKCAPSETIHRTVVTRVPWRSVVPFWPAGSDGECSQYSERATDDEHPGQPCHGRRAKSVARTALTISTMPIAPMTAPIRSDDWSRTGRPAFDARGVRQQRERR